MFHVVNMFVCLNCPYMGYFKSLITHLFFPISKRFFDKQFLKGFTALLNVWETGPCNKSY